MIEHFDHLGFFQPGDRLRQFVVIDHDDLAVRRRHQRGAAAQPGVTPVLVDDDEIILLGAHDLTKHVAGEILGVENGAVGIDGGLGGQIELFRQRQHRGRTERFGEVREQARARQQTERLLVGVEQRRGAARPRNRLAGVEQRLPFVQIRQRFRSGRRRAGARR